MITKNFSDRDSGLRFAAGCLNAFLVICYGLIAGGIVVLIIKFF